MSLEAAPAIAEATLPPGFEDTLVAKELLATALDFTPDGRMLVAAKYGHVYVYRNGTRLPGPALNLNARVCGDEERGLLGIAVDPEFESTHHVFVYYTFKKYGTCARAAPPNGPVNRVSRFTLRDDNTVDLASEVVLLDEIPSPAGYHNAGGLYFGKDNFLYVAVGDGGCDYAGDSGCASGNNASRDQNVLLGKVLRITTSGGIPSDNPFRGSDSARCNLTARTDPGKRCQEIYAWGLRNPFRLGFDPNAADTRFFINDVGQENWEEIDLAQRGADYGWNVREGHCATNSTTNCGPPPSGMTNPIYDYSHSSGCSAITGGAFVPNGLWPASYDGKYLFADYVCGNIRALGATFLGYVASDFASGLGGVVDLTFGPWGSSRALYYIAWALGDQGFQIHRVTYTGNRTPVAVASASPTSGPAPLRVAFDARASSDPDGDALTYVWNFGDGTPAATSPQPVHTYASAGTYQASLRVTDSKGASATDTVRVDVGNTPPNPAIQLPTAATRFRVGQNIVLRGNAADSEDGTLPSAALSWTVLLRHNTHFHPFLGPATGNDLTFTAPPPEDLTAAASSYLEIRLTATDSRGLSRTVSQELRPRSVEVTFRTEPTGLTLNVDGAVITAPQSFTSWEGYQFTVNAPTLQGASGKLWGFASWSDGGVAKHLITTPASPAEYTARFNEAKCGGGAGIGALLVGIVGAAARRRARRRSGALATVPPSP
jgi:glucose/arabinose dehydrogenase/PKD repeat protein